LTAGFTPKEAAFAISTYETQTFGVTMLRGLLELRSARARKSRRDESMDPASEVREHLQNIDFHAAVVHGIDTVLRGLAAQLEERKAGSKARRPEAS
jgi:hypothetical protein